MNSVSKMTFTFLNAIPVSDMVDGLGIKDLFINDGKIVGTELEAWKGPLTNLSVEMSDDGSFSVTGKERYGNRITLSVVDANGNVTILDGRGMRPEAFSLLKAGCYAVVDIAFILEGTLDMNHVPACYRRCVLMASEYMADAGIEARDDSLDALEAAGSDYWDYPVSEASHVVENDLKVVPVLFRTGDRSFRLRLCEAPEW